MKTNQEKPLLFSLPGKTQDLVIAENVVGKFIHHRQIEPNASEVGGQLFAEITEERIVIRGATGPYKQDRKSRFGFVPCRSQERKDIHTLFKQGLHYVGDWHTHPQKTPSPSGVDLSNIQDCFRKSKHELRNFILIIVGTDLPPQGLWISLHDGQNVISLKGEEH